MMKTLELCEILNTLNLNSANSLSVDLLLSLDEEKLSKIDSSKIIEVASCFKTKQSIFKILSDLKGVEQVLINYYLFQKQQDINSNPILEIKSTDNPIKSLYSIRELDSFYKEKLGESYISDFLPLSFLNKIVSLSSFVNSSSNLPSSYDFLKNEYNSSSYLSFDSFIQETKNIRERINESKTPESEFLDISLKYIENEIIPEINKLDIDKFWQSISILLKNPEFYICIKDLNEIPSEEESVKSFKNIKILSELDNKTLLEVLPIILDKCGILSERYISFVISNNITTTSVFSNNILFGLYEEVNECLATNINIEKCKNITKDMEDVCDINNLADVELLEKTKERVSVAENMLSSNQELLSENLKTIAILDRELQPLSKKANNINFNATPEGSVNNLIVYSELYNLSKKYNFSLNSIKSQDLTLITDEKLKKQALKIQKRQPLDTSKLLEDLEKLKALALYKTSKSPLTNISLITTFLLIIGSVCLAIVF